MSQAEHSAGDDRVILDAIAKWLARDVAPHALKMEQADTYPYEIVEQMKDLGLFGAVISPEWGGLGLSATTYAQIVTVISEEWMSLTGIFNAHLMMAKCEIPEHFRRQFFYIFVREFLLLVYTIIFEPFQLMTLPDLYRQLPEAWRKRKLIMANRRIDPILLRKLFH